MQAGTTDARGVTKQSMAEEFRPARSGDLDWTLLAPLLAHVIFIHIVVGVVRVTISYRTIELGLPVIWLGVISASFAILPIFTAVCRSAATSIAATTRRRPGSAAR